MAFEADIDEQIEPLVHLIGGDRKAGLKQLASLAETGHQSAILYMGLYLSEEACTTAEAMKWLLLANAFDSADAAWNIAMIAREQGDTEKMKRWIDRAADLGENDAITIRADAYDVDSFLLSLG